MQTVLYQFPISHYCEKARWALDYKGVAYQQCNLLPGLHARKLRRWVAGSSVPVLAMNGEYVQDSTAIIDFLDRQISTRQLTPADSAGRAQALQWERFAADHIGDPLRVYFYHYLLQNPRSVIDRFTQGGPWYGRLFYSLAFPRVRNLIRTGYGVSQQSADAARQRMEAAFTRLEEQLHSNDYLLDGAFTRADLSVGALMSPMLTPAASSHAAGLVPAEITEFRRTFRSRPLGDWLTNLYQRHRQANPR